MRTLVPVGLLLVVPLAAAAPVPRESPETRLRRSYGEPLDPVGDAAFRLLTDTRLAVTAGAGLRGLNPLESLNTAPRTLRPVTGDFTFSVRLLADPIPAGSKAASDRFTHSGGGGLLLWADERSHLRLSRSQYDPAGGTGMGTSYNFRGVRAGEPVPDQMNRVIEPDARPATLKLTRRGNKVTGAYSADGREWTTFEPVELDLPAEVKVGVYVAHNFDRPATVTFDAPALEMSAK